MHLHADRYVALYVDYKFITDKCDKDMAVEEIKWHILNLKNVLSPFFLSVI